MDQRVFQRQKRVSQRIQALKLLVQKPSLIKKSRSFKMTITNGRQLKQFYKLKGKGLSEAEAMAKIVSGSKSVGRSQWARNGGFWGNLGKAFRSMGPMG
jgi:hypothetical protein